ncbi:hypothetical protein [Phenylobacterium sp. J367]|uniref:hypothetical protein n=1 Tax=Phenylobacterium sp. J367 TaxID=2898435 RepID=UPI002151B3F9|nr:hypothetical protein [Phenylobacterium sp. J367]MCR5880609.1 hypothetical protein [Phenylobacterium sp. J367]
MPPHHRLTDADIARIGEGVRDLTLPKPEWTHAAHFAAAVWVIDHSDLIPERDMPGLIRAYNEATGVANTDASGYHETITLASIRAARAWLEARPTLTRAEALAQLLAGPYGRSDWLLAHWTKPRLFSVEARRAWVEPDLAPLPF